MEDRTCIECGRSFQGRSDKKFCTDACRNHFNNKQNADQMNYIRSVNNTLRKNRRILENLILRAKAKFIVTSYCDMASILSITPTPI